MATIFTKIINGEIPSYKIVETDKFYSFLDINPLALGHALVIPKEETDYIFDLPDEDLAEMIIFAKKIAKAIDKTVDCKRVGIAVIGLEVAHAHIHLVPLNDGNDINFSNPKKSFSKEEMLLCAKQISNNVD